MGVEGWRLCIHIRRSIRLDVEGRVVFGPCIGVEAPIAVTNEDARALDAFVAGRAVTRIGTLRRRWCFVQAENAAAARAEQRDGYRPDDGVSPYKAPPTETPHAAFSPGIQGDTSTFDFGCGEESSQSTTLLAATAVPNPIA